MNPAVSASKSVSHSYVISVSVIWTIFIFLIGSNMANYLSKDVPYFAYTMVGAFCFFAVMLRKSIAQLGSWDTLAWIAFIAVPLVLMVMSRRAFERGVWTSQLFCLLAFLIAALVAQTPGLRRFAGYAGICVVALLTLMNLYEFFVEPGLWSEIPERAAGFPVNPNISAACIVGFSALFLTTRVGKLDWVDYFVTVLSFVGVACTVSRGGILLTFLVFGMCFLVRSRAFDTRAIMGLALLPVLGVLLVAVVIPFLNLGEEVQRRVATFIGGSGAKDFDVERGVVVRYALSLFWQNPLTGLGVQTSNQMESGEGPHNMYVGLALDYGFFVFFGYMILAGRMLWRGIVALRNRSSVGVVALPMFVWMFVYGFFTHNLVYEPASLILLAFGATVPEGGDPSS